MLDRFQKAKMNKLDVDGREYNAMNIYHAA